MTSAFYNLGKSLRGNVEVGSGYYRTTVCQHHVGHVYRRKQLRCHNAPGSHCEPLLQSNHGVCGVCVCVMRACVVCVCACMCVCGVCVHVCVCPRTRPLVNFLVYSRVSVCVHVYAHMYACNVLSVLHE